MAAPDYAAEFNAATGGGAGAPAAPPDPYAEEFMAATKAPASSTTAASPKIDPTKYLAPGEIREAKRTGKTDAQIQDMANRRAQGNATVLQSVLDVCSAVDPFKTKEQSAALNARKSAYESQYGHDPNAIAGRLVGNALAEAPFFAVGGELVGMGGEALANAVPKAAPVINALTGASTPSSAIGRYAAGGVRGAVQGAAANALVGQDPKQGAEFGGALGAAAPMLYDAGKAVAAPFRSSGINPERARLAQKAVEQFGIPLRGSQISETPFANYADSAIGKLPFSGLEAQNEAQRTAFSKAVASTFGASDLSRPGMSDARARIGKVFDAVAAATTINDADTVLNGLGHVISEAQQAIPEGEVAPLLKQVENIGSVVDNGAISGESYQALTRKGAPLDRAMSSANPNIRYYAGQIRDVLDDALERNAPEGAAAALRNAKLQWKNMRTVQDLAAKAGIEGEISPSLLLNAVKKSYKDMAYSGAGDIGDLANIGQEFLKQPPSSGTAERMLLYRLLEGGLGAEAVMHPATIPPAIGLLASGRAAGAYLGSEGYRNRLLQSALNPSTSQSFLASPEVKALIAAMRRGAIPNAVLARQRLLSAPEASAP